MSSVQFATYDGMKGRYEAGNNKGMAAPPRVEEMLRVFALMNVTRASWELLLPHILADAGRDGLSLVEIARRLQHTTPSRHHDHEACEQALRRILRFLVAHYLVCCRVDVHNKETYSLHLVAAPGGDGGELNEDLWPSLAPFAAFMIHPSMLSMWRELPDMVVNGSVAGPNFYTLLDTDTTFRHTFDAAMLSLSSVSIRSFCTSKLYDMDPNREARSLVDVGGGSGHFAAAIARRYPHLTRVINFDLPPVMAAAPNHPGVENIEGDMFHSIPSIDIIFMKSVLHNWSDDDCIRILQNCSKSLIGCRKLVILDIVYENTIIDETDISTTRSKLAMDMVMLTLMTTKAKERKKNEWGIILKKAKFEKYKFFELEESRSLFSATIN